MTLPKRSSEKPQPSWLQVIGAILLVSLLGFWFWPRRPIPLSDRGYDFVISLYRVCNQRDLAGLVKVETLLSETRDEMDSRDESLQVIERIIAHAKSKRWDRASSDCRLALEDQVKR